MEGSRCFAKNKLKLSKISFILISLLIIFLTIYQLIDSSKQCLAQDKNDISGVDPGYDLIAEDRWKTEELFAYNLSSPSYLPETGAETMNSAESLTNVAINYWNQWKGYNKSADEWTDFKVKTCDTIIPGLQELGFNNIYWQTIQTNGKTEYYLYNAYYDNRAMVKMIRIIASQRFWSKSHLWCLLYFDEKRRPVLSEVNKLIDREKGPYRPVLLSCLIPESIDDFVPRAVSLIKINTCPTKVSNTLRVIYERPENGRQEFAVCHKPLRYADIDLSLRLIEWLELLRIFGVSKVYLYAFSVHENMERVLNHYQKQGFVDWRYSTLPGNQINNKYLYRHYHDNYGKIFWPQESLELNDCFYRNLHKYKFIANFDLDEMPVPSKTGNWSQMIQAINAKNLNTNQIQNYVLKGAKVYSNIESGADGDVPYSLKYLHRGPVHWKHPKCIHVSSKTKYLTTHNSMDCLEGEMCRTLYVDPNDGYFLHFRIGFEYNKSLAKQNDQDIIFDPSLNKYSKVLLQRIKFVVNKVFNK